MANGLFKSSNTGAGALSSAQAATSTDIKTASLFNSQQKQIEEQRKILAEYNQAQDAPKDNGGFFGGIGYAFEKIGLGFLQSIEGIWDFAAGGLADLFGAHDWAEKQIANDWVNYNHADEWFNPSEGWQFVGDVAGGIGTSLPAIATVAAAAAITFFSGGTLSPVAAGLIGGVVAGFGAAGTATKEAYNETGELTGATWGYGALSGFTEGVMEGVTDAIGFGVGSITKNIAKSTAKEGAKTVGKQIAKSAARKTFGKVVLESFLSEAFEEGVQELIDPVWKRITYDPNAESATFQQVAYAALVGGLSGAIMGGADVSVRNSINYFSGSKINGKGGANGVISLAETIAQTEGVNQSGNAQVDFVVDTLTELQESLKKTNGEVKTAKQKMLVGILSKANTAAPLSIVVSQNADAIVHDAETTAQRLNDIGYKTSKGETVTAEMLKQGVTGERGTREYRKSLSMAMKTNEALRTVAVMSAAGQLNMDAAQFQQSTLRGEQLATQADLNHFVETATDAQKRDVGERLGITDWATVTADELKSRIVDFSTNGGLDQYISEREQVKKLSELEISKKGLPKYVGSITQDGAVRYKFGDASVAIVKNGDTYLVYDYANDVISKPLSKKEANRVIKEIYAASAVSETNADVQAATETTEAAQQQTQSEKQAAELDAFAREHVPDYKKIVGAQQQAVRQTLRQARAAGVTEADQILYASVAARSGANIEFVSAETLGADADAGYSLKDGKILVNREIANNPKARTAAKILLHEFTHGMIHKGYAVKGKKGKKHLENRVLNDFFTTAIKGLSAEQQIEILTPYIERHGVKMQDFINGKVDISLDTYIELREELAAHFVERELGNSAALQRIISDKPTFKDKLLSFLKKSKSDYAANEKLSRAANALLKKYQNFFNKYATQTRFSPTITNDLSVRKLFDATTETDTGTRHALREALGKLGEYNELRKRHIESREGDTVSRNYDDIMDFIKSSDRISPVKRLHIGIVNDSTADMVKRKTGIDIQGYDFVLASNFIAHIFDSHGTTRTEAPRHQIPVTYKNIENIIETVIEPTDVTRVSDKNGVALKFTKEIDGKNVALTITSTKKSTLTLKSAWIVENSEGRTPSASAETLAGTPETNGRNLTTDSIAENSENVNRNGKKSGKKRYALSVDGENIAGEVEQTKNLVALHNLSETSLLKVLQLGGFPMPSIAVTRVDMGHTEYGDITVVFGKETIDPQRDSRNKVYARDGWTPTAPKIEYKTNDKVQSKIQKKHYELAHKVGYDAARPLYNFANDMERQLEFYGGEIALIGSLYDNTELMNLFLVDTGGEFIKPIYREIRSELSAAEITYREQIIDALGKDFLSAWDSTKDRKAFISLHKQKIVNALASIMQGKESIEETRANISQNFSTFALGNILNKATLFMKDGGISVRSEIDSKATQEAIRKATNKQKYVAWIDNLFGGIEEKTGIYNGGDPYTASGNRRSFEALHYEYTLENMVEAMSEKGEKGNSSWRGLTLGQLQAKLSKEFKSIDEIRLNSEKLTVKDEAAHEQFSETARLMLNEITGEMVDKNRFSDDVAYWQALDGAQMVIGEIADNKLFTLDKIAAFMKREYSTSYRYNESIGNKILGLFAYVQTENSTDYFEAKPRRAVAFSEIKNVLIPETVSEKLIKQLSDRGIPYKVYDSSENARTNAVQQMDGVRFALSETDSQGSTLSKAQREFFKNSKFTDKDGHLLTLYHQTAAEFTVFDTSLKGAGQHDYLTPFGIFMKPSSKNIGLNGDIQMALYANVTNPIEFTDRAALESYLRETAGFGKEIDGIINLDAEYKAKSDTAENRYMELATKAYKDPENQILQSQLSAAEREWSSIIDEWGTAFDKRSAALKERVNKHFRNTQYDGIILQKDGGGFGRSTAAYIAFEPNQVKSVSNAKPTKSNDIRYALADMTEEQYRFVSKLSEIQVTLTDNNHYNVYCENNSGLLEYEANNLTYEKLAKYFGEELAVDMTYKATEKNKTVKILRGTIQGFAKKYESLGNINADIYKVAKKKFGTTTNPKIAGYINTDGTMLDFSGGNNYRLFDHRDISEIMSDVSGDRAMNEYIGQGNIRIMPESPALEMNYQHEPTDKQYGTIRKVLDEFLGGLDTYGRLDIEFSDGSASIASRSYTQADSTLKILSEIRHFYKRGSLPVQSELSKFRYALPETDADPNINPTESDNSGAIGGLTRGQRAKFVANNTKFKVYSKTEAASVIDSIIAERLTLRDGQFEGVLSGKNRAEIIERLFTKLNNTPEGYRLGVALNIADYIINNAVLTDMYETFNDDSYAMGVLSTLRSYMHRMDLSGIQSEIQHKFDKKNSINLVWGAKKDGMAPDVIAQELQELGIRIEAINEADQFFEMLEIYESAKEQVNRKAEKIMLTAIGSQSEIEHLRQEIARDVLTAYDEKGTPSKYAKLVEKYTKRIADLKRDLSTAYKRNTLINRIIDGAAYLRDVATKRNYVGADIFAAPELTAWLKQLSKIKYRSDMRKSGVRKILLDYGQFYNKQNNLLYDENPDLSYIDENVLDALDYIRQNALSNKPLSMEELQAAQVIIASAKHLFNTYDQILIDGKKQKISDLAAEGNEIIKKSKNRTNKSFFNRIYGVFNKIIEPRVVIKSLENFNPNGILTRAYNAVTNGETEAGLLYIELTNDIDTYLKKKKGYKKRLASEYITVAGHEMTVGEAISLYELSKRPQAQEGLYEAGFSYIDKKGSKQSVRIAESDIAKLADTFTDADKGFIELVETFFNVASKQVKTDADMQILGYTNTSEEFYYPIKRDSGTIAKNITDARSIMADWANVYNFSFNKDVKTGAKNKLFITDVYSVITRHAKQLSTYAKMTVPLKNFSQIYAKNIGDKTNVVSIRNTINEQVWNGAEGYLSKLFADIQGRATSSSFIEKMRGAYAKYQLGANLKVIVSQVTSYPTAGVLLDTGVMAKGFVMKTNWAAMDKYCPYARVRNYERGIVKAEGVVDKVGKVGDVLTKPIQWTDRFTIGRLWNACQLQVQKNTGLKYGTVENMTQAGVMLEEVIRLTQPNYTNTERSELMRSDSDIVRSFTMFTSVPLKQLSRLVESFGEYNALRSLIKSGDTDTTLSKRYKLAKKKLRRTLAAVTVANLMYVLVGQFFKFLYNQQAEDEKEGKVTAKSVLLDMLSDFGSTTIGMLPIVRDIYGYFVNGYEINSFTGDMLNSIIGSTKSLFELATKAASGEEIKTQDYMRIFRDSLYGIGQVTGIPVRNINNLITGLIRRFSPSTAYSYTSLFYNPTYSKDIKAALKKGDYDLAETVMGMMLKDGRTGGLNERATKKLIELYDAGYTVLPKSIGDTLTYEGEKIQLTAAQRKAFKAVYSQANAEIEKLVNSADFASLPAEQQAKAIKLLYDAYYSKAQSSVLKVPNDNNIIMLNSAISASALAPHLAAISAIESDTDKKGNVINGSKKAKIIKYVMAQKLTTQQKLLLILALGYTIKDGDIKGISATKAKSTVARYITNLKISQAEKIALAEKCGMTVKNGRIYAR